MKLDRVKRARLLATLVAVIGLLNVISVFPKFAMRMPWLRELLPPEIALGSRTLVLVAGFFLMAVAWNLAQRKRTSWLIAISLMLISAFSHILKSFDVLAAVIALLFSGVLWRFRRDFNVRSDPGVVKSILFAAPYAIIFFLLYSILGFYLLRRDFAPNFNLSRVILETVNLATFQGERFYLPLTRHAHWFVESITLMTGVGVSYIVYSVMRPMLHPISASFRDRNAAAEIIHNYGSSSIAYFALSHDKSYFFNEDATSVVPYVLVRDVALAAGDPIGPSEDVGGTIQAYRDFCEKNGWISAFYEVKDTTLPFYYAAGFKGLKIGEEALIDVSTFDTSGHAKEELRRAVHRAKREGWTFLVFNKPIDDLAFAAQLRSISETWLSEKFGGEMGFTMGGTPIEGSDETIVTCVVDASGRVLAFMTLAPEYGVKGWAGDFLRRTIDAPHGGVEYLIVKTIDWLHNRGDSLLSLGLAPLANVKPENSEAFLSLEKVIELIYRRFNSAYHFQSLYYFKQKFAPRWESRYLIYPNAISLPRVMYALLNAQMPNFGLGEIGKLIHSP